MNRSLSYDSHDEFERFITSKLPTVPNLPGDDPLAEAMADLPVFDEQWLRRSVCRADRPWCKSCTRGDGEQKMAVGGR